MLKVYRKIPNMIPLHSIPATMMMIIMNLHLDRDDSTDPRDQDMSSKAVASDNQTFSHNSTSSTNIDTSIKPREFPNSKLSQSTDRIHGDYLIDPSRSALPNYFQHILRILTNST